MRGKQVSPPAPFRKVPFGGRWEVTTHTAGVNPAFLGTPVLMSLPLAGRVREGLLLSRFRVVDQRGR